MIGRIAILGCLVFFTTLWLSLDSADRVAQEVEALHAAIAQTRKTVRTATLEMRRSDKYFEDNQLPGLGQRKEETTSSSALLSVHNRIEHSFWLLQNAREDLAKMTGSDPVEANKLRLVNDRLRQVSKLLSEEK